MNGGQEEQMKETEQETVRQMGKTVAYTGME